MEVSAFSECFLFLFLFHFFKGDALILGGKYHVNKQFSTFDADHDLHSSLNCAREFKGAGWLNNCHYANLNGVYGVKSYDGIDWRPGDYPATTMAFTEMKFRPMY